MNGNNKNLEGDTPHRQGSVLPAISQLILDSLSSERASQGKMTAMNA